MVAPHTLCTPWTPPRESSRRAATSDFPAFAHDSYQFHAVLPFINIEGLVQELSELAALIGWEPDDEILSFVDDVDGVESIHKMTSAEGGAAVPCQWKVRTKEGPIDVGVR